MNNKYELKALSSSWAILMLANGRIMETFASESDAINALHDYESGHRFLENKKDVWIIDGAFVTEPKVGGTMIGQVASLDMAQFNVVCELTQSECDDLLREYFEEHGAYPWD